MQKILERCLAVIRGVIMIGFGIQIILGILWMCNAFAGLHSLGRGIVCVGQIAMLSAALCFLLKRSGRARTTHLCFVILAVLTFPMVMQCLVTEDVRVPAAALLMVETGCILPCLYPSKQENNWQLSALAALCWLAAGLLRGEYLWIGMIPMVFHLLFGREEKHEKRRMLCVQRRVLLILATAGLIAGIGSFYRPPADFITIVTDRVAWTTLGLDYEELDSEYRKSMSYSRLGESSYEATGVKEILVPYLVKRFGEQGARDVMKELTAIAWRDHRGRIIKEITWDLAGYTVPALVVPMQLQGRAYESYTGLNYRQLLQAAPRLGKFYLEFGCWWFLTALVLRAAVWLIAERSVRGGTLLMFGSIALFGTLYYTLSGAGKMDYKNILFINCVWLAWLASAAVHSGNTDGEESG